jgi:hypothetical protein
LIASSGTIAFGTGSTQALLTSHGGDGVSGSTSGGGGAGGAVRLIANSITGSVNINVGGGSVPGGFGGGGAPGRIRIESFSSTGFNPSVSPINKPLIISFAQPSSVTPANAPQLTITSVAGQNAPAVPANSIHGAPDIVVPNAQPNPVAVALAAANIPLNTTIEVRLTPQNGAPTTVQSTPLAGTVANSTATANVTLPVGMNLITATVVVNLSASARPLFIDGQQIARIEVAAVYGAKSEVTYVTRSGRRITNR